MSSDNRLAARSNISTSPRSATRRESGSNTFLSPFPKSKPLPQSSPAIAGLPQYLLTPGASITVWRNARSQSKLPYPLIDESRKGVCTRIPEVSSGQLSYVVLKSSSDSPITNADGNLSLITTLYERSHYFLLEPVPSALKRKESPRHGKPPPRRNDDPSLLS